MVPRPSHSVPTYNAESGRPSPHDSRGIFEMISVGGARLAFVQVGVQPCPGVGPPAVGRARRDAQGLRGLGDRQAGEVAQLDRAGLGLINPLGPLQGLVDSQGVEVRLRGGDRGVGDVLALAAAAWRWLCLWRAWSMRMRRMTSAAAAKKWPRPAHCWACSASTSRRYASCTRAVAWSVCPG